MMISSGWMERRVVDGLDQNEKDERDGLRRGEEVLLLGSVKRG